MKPLRLLFATLTLISCWTSAQEIQPMDSAGIDARFEAGESAAEPPLGSAPAKPTEAKPARLPVIPLPAEKISAKRPDGRFRTDSGSQTGRVGRLGLLGDAEALNTPFNVSSYTSRLVEDQQAGTVADVLAKDASVRSTGQTAGMLDAFFIRGFPVGEGNLGEVALDGQYGVAPNYRILSEYAERIEVIKGPAALLYGMSPNSGIGGVINVVPKRAPMEDILRLTTHYEASALLGGQIDAGKRFGEARRFGARLNSSFTRGNTLLDNQARMAGVGALALAYQGARLRASLDAIGQREDFDAPSRPFLVAPGVTVPDAPAGLRNVTQAWEWSEVEDRSLLLRGEYDLTRHLTLFVDGGGARTEVARLFGTPTILNAAGDTRSTPGRFQFEIDRLSGDAGLRAHFQTVGVRHAVSLQASLYRDELDRGSANGTAISSNIYAPKAQPAQDVAKPARVPKISETTLGGFALADGISMLGERVQATLGARFQSVKSDNFDPATGALANAYDKSTFTPMVGLLLKASREVSWYANYIEGLSKGDIAPPTASNAGEIFAPYKSRQTEIGLKLDLGGLIATVSAFQIEKPAGQLTGGVFAVDGEQRNRGVEVSSSGEPVPGLRLLGGAVMLDAELTRTNNPSTQGRKPVGVPTVQGGLSAEGEIPWVRGLALSGGIAYTDKQFIDPANSRSLPAATHVDLGARYRLVVAGKSATLRAGILNAFDQEYWSGAASWGGFGQGAPRSVKSSITVDL